MEVHGSHQHWEEDFPISEKASIGSSIALSQPQKYWTDGYPSYAVKKRHEAGDHQPHHQIHRQGDLDEGLGLLRPRWKVAFLLGPIYLGYPGLVSSKLT